MKNPPTIFKSVKSTKKMDRVFIARISLITNKEQEQIQNSKKKQKKAQCGVQGIMDRVRMKIQYWREWSCAQNQAIDFIKPLSRRTKTIWGSRGRKQGKGVEQCLGLGLGAIHASVISISLIKHLERYDQSRQIDKFLLELSSLDLRLPRPLPHPLRLLDLLDLIYFLHILVLLICRLGLIILNVNNRKLIVLFSLIYQLLTSSPFLHRQLIRVYLHNLVIFLMVVLLPRLVVDHLQDIILNLYRLILTIEANDIIFIPYVLYRNLMEVRRAGEEMISVEVYPCMETIKFQLNIRQIFFIGKLIVQFILVLYTISFDLLLSYQLRELPIYNPTLLLVPQQQVIAFELLLCCEPHPFLRGDSLVVIFEHFLAYDITDGVDDIEEIIVKLVFALHFSYYLQVSCLTCSFYEDLRQFMQLNAFIFLLQWLQTVPLLYPLYLLIVIFAGRQCSLLDIPSVHDRILGGVKIDDVELYLIEVLTHLQHL